MIDYEKLQKDCIAWKENVEFAQMRFEAERKVVNNHIESRRQALNRLSNPLREVIAQLRDYPISLVGEKLLLPSNVRLIANMIVREQYDLTISVSKKQFLFKIPFDAELFVMRVNRFVKDFPKDDVAEQQRKSKIATAKREIIRNQKILKDLESVKVDFTQ